MFLHIVAVDKQLSVHADENQPLDVAIAEVYKHHKKKRNSKHEVVDANDEFIDSSMTPKEIGLKENEVIRVRPEED